MKAYHFHIKLLCQLALSGVQNESITKNGHFPVGTQRLEDVPSWSYFGRDVPENNRTKIGRIKFLSCFSSSISGMQLASKNIQKFFQRAILWKVFKSTCWGRAKNVTLQFSLWGVFRNLIGRISKTEGMWNN